MVITNMPRVEDQPGGIVAKTQMSRQRDGGRPEVAACQHDKNLYIGHGAGALAYRHCRVPFLYMDPSGAELRQRHLPKAKISIEHLVVRMFTHKWTIMSDRGVGASL